MIIRHPTLIAPLVSFEAVDMDDVNACLEAWGHRMGPLNRPMGMAIGHGLFQDGRLIGVVATSDLVRERVAGLDRRQAVELARVCAEREDLCRILVRMWREFVFPALGRSWGVSYQDAAIHTGNLYRFDGWVRLATSRSGTDARSGRKGRRKVIWGWHPHHTVRAAIRDGADVHDATTTTTGEAA